MLKHNEIFITVLLFFSSIFCHAENKAVTPQGSGTKTDPYKITVIENFVWLSHNFLLLSELSHISLENDIDASETKNWNEGKGFAPIGDRYHSVVVDFNGKGHVINGLFMNCSTGCFFGFFASIKNSKISDLVISNSYISGYRNLGAITGNAESSSFERCSVVESSLVCSVTNVNELGEHVWIGGIVGNASGNCVFDSCNFSGNIYGTAYLGGIAGRATTSKFVDSQSEVCFNSGLMAIGGIVGEETESEILRCISLIESDCDITDNSHGIGGIVGFGGSNVKCSCAKGKLSGNMGVGGIVGEGGGLIENSYSRCELSGDLSIGGVVGFVELSCVISNCYALGEINAESSYGGIVGDDCEDMSVINNCYHSLKPLNGWKNARDEMKKQSTYVGWDFDTVWDINEGEGYPYFQWEMPEPVFAFSLLSLLLSIWWVREQ